MVGMHPAWLALTGTGFTFLCTAVGAAMVFCFAEALKQIFNASFWDLPLAS